LTKLSPSVGGPLFWEHSVYMYVCMLGYPPMALFLNKTGRPIALSCEYALYQRGSLLEVKKCHFTKHLQLNCTLKMLALI